MATADRFDTNIPPAGKLGNPRPPAAAESRCGIGRAWEACSTTRKCATRSPWSLRADDFYADANQKLYRQILALHDEGKRIDVTLLVERLQKAGELEAVGGKAHLAEVLQSVPYAANVMHYAEIVRQKATLRALIHASTEILREAWDPGMDVRDAVNQAEEKIFAVRDRRSTDQVANIHDVLVEAFDRIDARMDRGEGGGIPMGFRDLDAVTGGLHGSEFIVLAARPSMGKTAMATNIAEHVAIESGVPTLFVSLEMARLELAQRLLCSQGRIDANKFRSWLPFRRGPQASWSRRRRSWARPRFLSTTRLRGR